MSDPVNLGFERALRADDNRLVTPVDILRQAIADIENGQEAPTSAMVLFWERGSAEDDAAFSTMHYAANLSGSERIALLEMIKARVLAQMGLME